MDNRPNENEEKIVAKNEPVIDGISSGTTYYNSSNKKGDKIFMMCVLIISGVFIFFLPTIYNFAHEHNISDLFNKKTEEQPSGVTPENPDGGEDKQPEVTFDAKVCTKATADDVVTAHTLYFSEGKLKKMSLSETYTLGENYNSEELDSYYANKKQLFDGYDSISIETLIDEQTYNATALIDLETSPTNASELMTVKVEFNSKDKDVLKAYEAQGFDCE